MEFLQHYGEPRSRSFSPLKSNFNLACDTFIRTNLTEIIVSHISLLLTESHPKTAVVASAVNGFKVTEIWPVDGDIFNDSDFAMSLNRSICTTNTVRAAESENSFTHSTSQRLKNKTH